VSLTQQARRRTVKAGSLLGRKFEVLLLRRNIRRRLGDPCLETVVPAWLARRIGRLAAANILAIRRDYVHRFMAA